MRRSLSDISPVLTIRDLCSYLKVNQSTVYRLIKAGKLPAFKVGSDWRFNREEIDRWRLESERKPSM
jgi:excisionase family DNA binding protein